MMQALNMWTDDFASLGTRTPDMKSGNFLIAGPTWDGMAPKEVKATFRCSTRYAWVLVQIFAASPQDFPEIHALQDQLAVTPLSAWGKPYMPPSDVPIDPYVDTSAAPYDQVRLMTGEMFFKRLAKLLKDNPPYPDDAKMIGKLKKLGVEAGKGFHPGKIDPAVLEGINQAPPDVWKKFAISPFEMDAVNGWINMLNLGRYGTDYRTRAFAAYMELGALTSDDAIYPSAFVDGEGNVLDGAASTSSISRRMDCHRRAPESGPSRHIGRTSMCKTPSNATESYLRCTLNISEDGSLDIYIQAKSPGADKEANWLPCPPSGPFNLTIRVYQPNKDILDGRYKLPPVKRGALTFAIERSTPATNFNHLTRKIR